MVFGNAWIPKEIKKFWKKVLKIIWLQSLKIVFTRGISSLFVDMKRVGA